MSVDLNLAGAFYAALASADVPRLYEILHPEFVGHVSEGMPEGVGGTHHGPKAMLENVWGPIAHKFAVRPVPEHFLSCDDGKVVALGAYVGEPPDADRPLRARFAHVLSFREGRINELHQITDTRQWSEVASAQRLAVVRRMFAAVERRDPEMLLDTYAGDIEITEPASLPYGGVYHGHEGGMRHGIGYVNTWDPIQTPADRQQDAVFLDAGEHVFVHWHQKATLADGRHLDTPVLDIIEIQHEKVTSLQMFHRDTYTVLEFLGATRATAS
jgi:ketosteroid isomerase-like protein